MTKSQKLYQTSTKIPLDNEPRKTD